ncbi:MAG: hypothetical protein WBV53_01700 [Solirubrobacterales bacterium]
MQAGGSTIEIVRGGLDEQLSERILRFWSELAALEGEAARQRLPEVVCVALEGEEVTGVNSVAAEVIPLLERRLWRYRGLLPGADDGLAAKMFNAAFEALAEGFDPDGPQPVGVASLISDPEEMRRRDEAFWPEEQLVFAGYLPDGRQLRLRYFWNAKIGPGPESSPPLEATRDEAYPVDDRFRVEPLAESEVTADDVLALWGREQAVPTQEAQRRVHEVELVAVLPDEGVVGVSTAYIQRNPRLGMDFWHYRTYVARSQRHSNLAGRLALAVRDHLEGRFVSGQDTRAAGMIFEIENEGLKTYFNRALWLPLDFVFIGENQRGDHVRVHYFPGARVPAPAASGPSDRGAGDASGL